MRYVFGDYELDEQLYELRRAGESLKLDRKVFDVLTYLVQHHERLVTKDELLETLWPGQIVGEAALTRCITSARKALGDDGNRQEFIKTQHGRGYRFVAPLTITPSVPSSKSPVPSHEAGTDSQCSVDRRQQEERQPATGENSREVGSLDAAQQNPGEETTTTPRIPLRSIRAPASPRFWPRMGFGLAIVSLLIGAALTVHYLSRPILSTQDSALRPDVVSAALPLPDKPSIIVLPFVNLSGDPTQEYFSDGMTEEITSRLSRLSSLFVIARTSAFFYKGKPVKGRDISKEMGVRYVLEGSARKADGQVRILAHLIDATTGEQVWSEHYDRPLKNIFALQDEIVQKIVTTLRLQLTLQEQGWVVRKRTDNLEAYDTFLHGLGYFLRFTKEGTAQARPLFEQAIVLDPQYAEAYAYLGWTYQAAWIMGWSTDPQNLKRTFELEQQALSLDASLPWVHSILGFSIWYKTGMSLPWLKPSSPLPSLPMMRMGMPH
jgi:TolB-like protein/DNA-binding winged helix-turn-helix (wHTH) protein